MFLSAEPTVMNTSIDLVASAARVVAVRNEDGNRRKEPGDTTLCARGPISFINDVAILLLPPLKAILCMLLCCCPRQLTVQKISATGSSKLITLHPSIHLFLVLGSPPPIFSIITKRSERRQ